jgi:hypothetical protein
MAGPDAPRLCVYRAFPKVTRGVANTWNSSTRKSFVGGPARTHRLPTASLHKPRSPTAIRSV